MSTKYDSESAQEVKDWVQSVTNQTVTDGDLLEFLKDGTIICKLANVILPDSAPYKQSKMPFVQMENIASFLRAAEKIGVPHHELFETVDLFEKQNPDQVLITLRSLSRHAHEKNSSIPVLGPKLVSPNQRKHFSKQTSDIPAWNERQYGFMGGASQGTEGVVFGGRRDIISREQKPAPAPPKIQFSTSSNKGGPPKPPPKPVNLQQRRANPLGDDDDDDDDESSDGKMPSKKTPINTQLIAHGNKSALQSQQIEDSVDPSVFAYDEVYDNMKSAELSLKEESQKDKEDRKPKYIDQLLKTKSIREKDRQRAKDVKLKREREAEGDEFADKEMFVTSAYKKHQEELEAQAKEDEKKSDKTTMAGFYKNALERSEKQHEAIVNASESKPIIHDFSETLKEEELDPVMDKAKQINEEAGYQKVRVNDNGEIVDEKEAFGAGLNIVSKKSTLPSLNQRRHASNSKITKDTASASSSSKRPQQNHHSRELNSQLQEHNESQKRKENESRENLVSNMKSTKADLQAISSARERYLERKRQQQNS